MKIALQGNTLLIKDADNVQFTIIKSWNKMKWNKRLSQLEGIADMELLDKLSRIVKLPPAIEAQRENLHKVQDALDRERVNPEPVPMCNYPVKLPLYRHQIRGANMAMITFGFIEPDGK